jgi:toxin ParE1/3/4
MTLRYTLSTQARQDLKDIKDFIAQDSLDRAEQFVKMIAERFQALANFPGMGRSYNTLAENLRGLPIGNYIIFYRATEQSLSIERILSGYRDLDTMFSEPDET